MTYAKEHIAAALDLAVLKPTATQADVLRACDLANKHRLASVCVAPTWVGFAARRYRTTAVIGFPYGNTVPLVKHCEAVAAIRAGAKELDVVLNYGCWAEHPMAIFCELRTLLPLARRRGVKLKAIVEASSLTYEQLVGLSRLCAEFGVDFVKSSTGVSGNAAVWDVGAILDAVRGTKTQVKASGGIANYGQAAMFLAMGCARIGSSKCEELFP